MAKKKTTRKGHFEFYVNQKLKRNSVMDNMGRYIVLEVMPHHVVIQFIYKSGATSRQETVTKSVARKYLKPDDHGFLTDELATINEKAEAK